jgi:uncharacterized protein YkwD
LLEDRTVPTTASLTGGVLNVFGTSGPDVIQIGQSNGLISISDVATSFSAAQVSLISVEAGASDDVVAIGQSVTAKTWVFGNSGNDRITGGGGSLIAYGGSGNDTLVGGAGADSLYGGLGTNSIAGQAGDQVSFGTPYTPETPSQIAQQVIQLTNDYRQAHGLAPLQSTSQLTAMADLQARNMVSMVSVVGYNTAMSHLLYGVPEATMASRADFVGYDWSALGENIAYGYGTAEAVVQAWINSPGHRANILNASFTQIGVSVQYTSQGIPYFSQEFGAATALNPSGPSSAATLATSSSPAPPSNPTAPATNSPTVTPAKTSSTSSANASVVVTQGFGTGATQAGQIYATGSGAGSVGTVTVYDLATGAKKFQFQAYGSAFRGGVHVAVADITGDGKQDVIVSPGVGMSPLVKVYDGVTGRLFRSFWAYSIYWRGGVNVAVGDVNGDGRADIVTGAEAGGGPNVKAFDGKSLAAFRNFMAYDPRFRGGVRVAVGDVNGDGKADIITAPGAGMASFVKTFSGASGALMSSFMAYDAGWAGGAFVAAGDLDGDGKADIVTGADAGGLAHVKAFNATNQSLLASFASDAGFSGGVRVAVRDVDGDGKAEIMTAQGKGGNKVRLFDGSGRSLLATFLAGDLVNPTGLFVG